MLNSCKDAIITTITFRSLYVYACLHCYSLSVLSQILVLVMLVTKGLDRIGEGGGGLAIDMQVEQVVQVIQVEVEGLCIEQTYLVMGKKVILSDALQDCRILRVKIADNDISLVLG